MFAIQVENMFVGDCDGHFHDGFYAARDQASEIVYRADCLIKELCNALENRHADDLVDELKEKYGI